MYHITFSGVCCIIHTVCYSCAWCVICYWCLRITCLCHLLRCPDHCVCSWCCHRLGYTLWFRDEWNRRPSSPHRYSGNLDNKSSWSVLFISLEWCSGFAFSFFHIYITIRNEWYQWPAQFFYWLLQFLWWHCLCVSNFVRLHFAMDICLSVRPSVCQTRAPWQNEIIVCKSIERFF